MLLLQFTRIEEIMSIPASKMLDVIGILESSGDHQTITLKSGRDAEKRSVVVRDQSNHSIEITLWGAFATTPGDQIQQV